MMTRVKRRRVLLALGAPLLFASACTALVQFHDYPDPCANGACADGGGGDGGPRDGGMETAVDVVHICNKASPGWYCGYAPGLSGKAGSPDDLVHCVDAAPFITFCEAGCVSFPPGTPDMCNMCGKREGYYCAGQLGSTPEAKDYRVYCSGGVMTPLKACVACVPGPGDAACNP